MKKRTGGLLILFFFVTAMAFLSPARAGKITPADEGENTLIHDIDILKTLNALKLSKDQLRQMVDIVREAVQKRDKTLKEIRAQLVLGKTMDALKELQAKLDKDTEESVNKASAILDENQKRTAELLFAPIPQKEWNELLSLLPKAGQFLSDKRDVDTKLGNKGLSDETVKTMTAPLALFFKDIVDIVTSSSREDFARKFFTHKTLELLKERLTAAK